MTLLDEKEPSVNLGVIVVVVSLVACAAFAGLYALNSAHGGAQAPAQAQAQSANT